MRTAFFYKLGSLVVVVCAACGSSSEEGPHAIDESIVRVTFVNRQLGRQSKPSDVCINQDIMVDRTSGQVSWDCGAVERSLESAERAELEKLFADMTYDEPKNCSEDGQDGTIVVMTTENAGGDYETYAGAAISCAAQRRADHVDEAFAKLVSFKR